MDIGIFYSLISLSALAPKVPCRSGPNFDLENLISQAILCIYKMFWSGVEHSSAGSPPSPYVEAIVLVAGDPGSNPEPSGLILRVIPLSLPPVSCLSTLS